MSPIFSGFWCVLLVSSITSHFDSNALARPPTQARKWRKVSGIANLLPRARRLQDRPSAAFDLSWYLRNRARVPAERPRPLSLPASRFHSLSVKDVRRLLPPRSLLMRPSLSLSLSLSEHHSPSRYGRSKHIHSLHTSSPPASLPPHPTGMPVSREKSTRGKQTGSHLDSPARIPKFCRIQEHFSPVW